MARLECRTVVYVPRERVYEFLVDFEGYADYAELLDAVERDGDGGPGTVYTVSASWWRFGHTVRSEVTGVDPPERIDWRLLGPVDATGAWLVEDADARREPANRVALVVDYDPGSLDAVDLPVSWIADRIAPLVERQAREVVRRIVADLEGESRPVTLDVRTGPA